jgi:hypothetical protein
MDRVDFPNDFRAQFNRGARQVDFELFHRGCTNQQAGQEALLSDKCQRHFGKTNLKAAIQQAIWILDRHPWIACNIQPSPPSGRCGFDAQDRALFLISCYI